MLLWITQLIQNYFLTVLFSVALRLVPNVKRERF